MAYRSRFATFFTTPPPPGTSQQRQTPDSPLAHRGRRIANGSDDLPTRPGHQYAHNQQTIRRDSDLETNLSQGLASETVTTPSSTTTVGAPTSRRSIETWAVSQPSGFDKSVSIVATRTNIPAWRVKAQSSSPMAPPSPRTPVIPASAMGNNAASRTFSSIDPRIQRAWFKLEPHLSRLYPEGRGALTNCPYIPRNIRDFSIHVEVYETMWRELDKAKITDKANIHTLQTRRLRRPVGKTAPFVDDVPVPPLRKPLDGKLMTFGTTEDDITPEDVKRHPGYHPNPANRSAVLCQQTIWCPRHSVSFRDAAPWPTLQEMKWEGSQRVATEGGKYGRFLALPRVPAASDLNWQLLPLTKFYPLDEVWRVPNEEDVYAPTEEIPEEIVKGLLGSDVLEAIDPVDKL